MSARCVQTTLRQAHSLWQAGARRQLQTSAIRSAGSHVFHVKDDADFQKQVVDSKKPFIVDFHATWCGPCKVLEPRLEKVLTNYNKNLKDASEDKQIKLAKIDIDQLGELSGQFNVQAVPTGKYRFCIDSTAASRRETYEMVAIKNGREVSRFTGAADESRIQKMIDQLSR